MKYNISNLENIEIFDLYEKMLKSRMIEEKMLILLRQGKISKWFSLEHLPASYAIVAYRTSEKNQHCPIGFISSFVSSWTLGCFMTGRARQKIKMAAINQGFFPDFIKESIGKQ